MFVVLLAGLIAIPKTIEFTNRVLEEYIIPRLVMKKALTSGDSGDQLYPYPLDMALTPKDLRALREMGAFEILKRGVNNHHHIAASGQAKLCECCKRLNP